MHIPPEKNVVEQEYNSRESLIIERNKTIAHCINLECRNEQLNLLIEKLNRLANQRKELMDFNNIPVSNNFDIKCIGQDKSSLHSELDLAKQNRTSLEKHIGSLKSRIFKINELISNK